MAVSSHGEAAAAAASGGDDADFVRDSFLVYMVPLATDSKLEQALEQCDGSLQSFIESVQDREWLFFDETADVYFILRTPYQPNKQLQAYLDRLAVSLEAKIVNNGHAERESPPVVEVIFNGTVENVSKPLAVVHDLETEGSEDDDDEDEEGDEEEEEDEDEDEDDDENDENKKDKQSKKKKALKKDQDDRPARQTYVVWKLPVFLARPRARLQGPTISFAAVATLGPPEPGDAGAGGGRAAGDGSGAHPPAGYLRSREPSGLNLLASFVGDPALGSVRPRLSAQRVARVAPAGLVQQKLQQAARNQTRALRGLPAITFQIYPAVHARVRFARPNTVPASSAVVALLELDCTPFFECEAVLKRIDLELRPGGTVADLHSDHGLGLPLYCVARDHFTFLYHLSPESKGGSDLSDLAPSPSRELFITVEIQALVNPGVCTPTMKLSWTTGVDFVPPVNPGFGSAVPPASLQRSHRPSQLSIDGMASFVAPAVSRPDALQMVDTGGSAVATSTGHSVSGSIPAPLALSPAAKRSVEAHLPELGITMTFTAPDRPVYAGEPFSWTVFVVNRSGSTAPRGTTADGTALAPPTPLPPRKLALLVLPKRRRNDIRVLRPPSTRKRRSTIKGRGGEPGDRGSTKPGCGKDGNDAEDVADAVLDENIVHAMQRSSLVGSTDVVSVTADARVGPLAPNACHVVELRFVALKAGLVSIEAVRVVDLGSQEHVDIRDLPVMMIAQGQRPAGEA